MEAGRRYRLFIAGAVAAVLFARCMPDPLEIERIDPPRVEMVVSSQIVPGEGLLVMVTRTVGALEASDDSDPFELLGAIAVNDAIVTLEGPRRIDTLRFRGTGVYSLADRVFEPGEKYHLIVRSTALGTVSATTEVRAKASFKHIEAELYYNGLGDTLAQITYTLVDPEEKNWYMLNVQEVERDDVVANMVNPRTFTRLISDDGFNGQSYGERFRIFPRGYKPGDSIAVTLANISEEYYHFMKLRQDNRFSFLEFVSEPVDYPSNVTGGRGFFNLYTPEVKIFVFE